MKFLTATIKLVSTAFLGLSIGLILFTQAQALTPTEELLQVQKQWANSVYNTKDKKVKYAQLQQLTEKTNTLSNQYPNDAKLLAWNGIVLSTFAGIKGGLGGLSLAKKARVEFEKAKKIDATTLDGSIYTSLGTLYSKVPRWPLGFGDKKKANDHFIKSLKLNPDGVDINYFYAEFLIDINQKEKAITYLKKALNAPARPSRPVADRGRKQEAAQLLAKIQ